MVLVCILGTCDTYVLELGSKAWLDLCEVNPLLHFYGMKISEGRVANQEDVLQFINKHPPIMYNDSSEVSKELHLLVLRQYCCAFLFTG